MDNNWKYKLLAILTDSTLGVISLTNIDRKGEKDLYVGYRSANPTRGAFFLSDSINMLPTNYTGALYL